jgi:hypothetical protein
MRYLDIGYSKVSISPAISLSDSSRSRGYVHAAPIQTSKFRALESVARDNSRLICKVLLEISIPLSINNSLIAMQPLFELCADDLDALLPHMKMKLMSGTESAQVRSTC